MSPPKPPRPGSIVVDAVVPGAVNDYREASFGERKTPLPPPTRRPTQRGAPAPPHEVRPRISNPPPPESMPPPPSFRRGSPEEDGPPLERARARGHTLTGLSAPDSNRPPMRIERDDGARDSVVDAVNSASSLALEVGARGNQLRVAERARVAAEAEAAGIRQHLKELAELDHERAKLRAKWEKLALKLAGAVVSAVVAVCGYIGWRVAQLEHKSEKADVLVEAQKAVIAGLPDRVTKIEEYERADKVLDDCQKSYLRSFARRTSGYDITTLPDSTVVHWGSEGTKPNITMFPFEQCVPPGSTAPRPPGAPASQ